MKVDTNVSGLTNLKRRLRILFPGGAGRKVVLRMRELLGFINSANLPKLAVIYGTDKWGVHWYAKHYANHFRHLRRKKIVVFEIGVGGYEDPTAGGGSLRMWRRYFSRAVIVGLDYFDKSPHAEKRIRIYQGDQSDHELLKKIVAEVGRPHIIIDDGSHENRHVLASFETLFPLLDDNGIYVVEDTQTAYWPDAGGLRDVDHNDLSTSMNYLKALTDGINHSEFRRPDYVPSYTDKNIVSMSFYHNLVFIQKGANDEASNLPNATAV